MSERNVAIINVSKGLLNVSLLTLEAVAGATGNAPVAGLAALAHGTLESGILKPLVEMKPEEQLKVSIPPWWTGEPQLESWQAVCSRIENRLPAILKGVEQRLPGESQRQPVNYLSTADVKRLFMEQVVQQIPWEVKTQDRYLVADYVTPLLLEKTTSVLRMAIDNTRQNALAQWMTQVTATLTAIQQATISLSAAGGAGATNGAVSTSEQQAQPTAVAVQLAQKQQQQAYDVYISYHKADRAEVTGIAEKLKARGILPWLDVQELKPGEEKIRVQEAQIRHIPVAAVFVGQHEIMGEQEMETHSFIKQFIKRNIPIIPVILASGQEEPDLPPFLGNFSEVNFHSAIPDPVGPLVWGVNGVRP
jgi:TIR domain